MSDTCSKKQHQGLWILYKDTDSYLQVKWVMMIINQAVCLTMNVTSYWCLLSKAQYTPPTRRNCRVSSRRRCVHEFATSWRQFRRVVGVNTPVGSRDPVYNFLCWQLTSDDIMTLLLKKIVKIHYTADSNVYKHAASLSYVISYFYAIGCRIVNWVTADGCVVRPHCRIRRQSSRIHVHTANADATKQFRLVGVGGV